MAARDTKITFDIESVSKVTCTNKGCLHNLKYLNIAACNLKHVFIDEKGRCRYFIDEHADRKNEN